MEGQDGRLVVRAGELVEKVTTGRRVGGEAKWVGDVGEGPTGRGADGGLLGLVVDFEVEGRSMGLQWLWKRHHKEEKGWEKLMGFHVGVWWLK